MKVLPISLLLFFILLCNDSYCQWAPIQGLDGSTINDLAQNDDFIFAITQNGLYRSSDDGFNWSRLNVDNNKHYHYWSFGVNGSTIVTYGWSSIDSIENHLFLSNDNGDNWTKLFNPSSSQLTNVAVNDFAIFLSNQSNVWYSTNEGNTWQTSTLQDNSPGSLFTFEPMRRYDQYILMGSVNKLFRCDPDSDNWTTLIIQNGGVQRSFQNVEIIDDSIYLARPYLFDEPIYYSNDYGQSWNESQGIGIDWKAGQTDFSKIGSTIYSYNGNEIIQSTNKGATWSVTYTKPNGSFTDLISRGNSIIAGDLEFAVLRSDDLGTSFTSSNSGLEAQTINPIDIEGDQLLAGARFNGIYKYDLLNENWSSTPIFPGALNYRDIERKGDTILVCFYPDKLSRTFDGGQNWEDKSPDNNNLPSFFFTKIKLDNEIIWGWKEKFNSGSPLFRSDNFGDNWEQFEINLNNTNYSPQQFSSNENYWFVNNDSIIFRSDNNGASWEITTTGLNFSNPSNPTSLYSITRIFPFENAIFCVLKTFSHDYRFYRSLDNGQNWELLESYISTLHNDVSDMLKIEDKFIRIASGTYRVPQLSQDTGSTWINLDNGISHATAHDIDNDNDFIYLSMQGQGLYKWDKNALNFENISGVVYLDENNDGIYNSNENPIANAEVLVENSNTLLSTDQNGRYQFNSNFNQSETISIVPPNISNNYFNLNPESYTINEGDSTLNFGIHFIPNLQDLKIELKQANLPAQGFNSQFTIIATNVGTQTITGNILLEFDDAYDYSSAVPIPTNLSNNTLTWNFTNFQILESREIEIELTLNSSSMPGQNLVTIASINPIANDQTPLNNSDTLQSVLQGVNDSNNKTVYPEEFLDINDILVDSVITYTIQFQNNSSSIVETVFISDQLSSFIDFNSLEILSNSHPFSYNLSTNGLLEIEFESINLPGSNSSLNESQGFIEFSVKPNSDIMVGSTIENYAEIQFDSNDPYQTNTVLTEITQTISTSTPDNEFGKIEIHPNPSVGEFSILIESKHTENIILEIINTNGQQVFSHPISSNSGHALNLGKLSTGVYFIKAVGKSHTYFEKLIIEQ